MKILIISDSFPENNTDGIFVYERILQLAKEEIECFIIKPKICLRKNLSIELSKNYLIDNNYINVFNVVRVPRSYRLLGFKRKLRKFIIRNNIDVVHCHFAWNAFNVYNVSEKLNIPLVVTMHGSDIHTFPEKNKKFFAQTHVMLKHASSLIFVSEFLRNKAEKLFGSLNNTSVIQNGIDETFISKVSTVHVENVKNLLYVGRLEKIKRVEFLPEIISTLVNKGVDCRLHIVGDGTLKDLIKQKGRELKIMDRLVFYGMVEHNKIPEKMKGKDCMLLISQNEGWPCVVLEAQASGIPVVGTRNGGIAEAVGEGGIVVDDSDLITNISTAVKMVLERPFIKEDLIKRAKKFTWYNIVKEEIEIYVELLK